MAKFKIIHAVTVMQLDLVEAESADAALEKLKTAITDPVSIDTSIKLDLIEPVDSFEPVVLGLYPTIQQNYMEAFLKDVVIK